MVDRAHISRAYPIIYYIKDYLHSGGRVAHVSGGRLNVFDILFLNFFRNLQMIMYVVNIIRSKTTPRALPPQPRRGHSSNSRPTPCPSVCYYNARITIVYIYISYRDGIFRKKNYLTTPFSADVPSFSRLDSDIGSIAAGRRPWGRRSI